MNEAHKPSTVLVIGGAGYIGSHMVAELVSQQRDVIVLDDLSKGHRHSVPEAVPFFQGCLSDQALVSQLITEFGVGTVMHFAAFSEVGESVTNPAKYYRNNVSRTINLLEAMRSAGCNRFVFSSTAAVFGEPVRVPIDESHPTAPINPYGRSKLMVENMLRDFSDAYDFRFVSLRYFNAAGAHPDGLIGEWHEPETHLIPLVLQAASGRREAIKIFGDDYDTPDGSCVRDYIHVCDLASAHWQALEYLEGGGQSDIFNLGNGAGYSVQEIVDSAERVTELKITATKADRRAGDPATLVADAKKAKAVLGWQPKYDSLDDIVRHAWAWEQQLAEKLGASVAT